MSWEYDNERMTSKSARGWLSYGDFGLDTYGLHTKVLGEDAIICVRAESRREAEERATELLDMLADGCPSALEDGVMMSVADAARLLGVTPQRVYQMIKEDKIEAKRYGSTWMVYANLILETGKGPRPCRPGASSFSCSHIRWGLRRWRTGFSHSAGRPNRRCHSTEQP